MREVFLLMKYNLTRLKIYSKQGRKFKFFCQIGLKYRKIVFKYWKYILNTLKSVSKYEWFGKGGYSDFGLCAQNNTSLSYRPTTVGWGKSLGRVFLISPALLGLDRIRLRQRNSSKDGKTQAMPKAFGKSQRRLNRTTRSDPTKFIET